MLQKSVKIITWIFLLLLSIFVLIWGLLQIPSIQNRIVDRVAKDLSKTLNTVVDIDRVSIDFFNSIVLRGVYLESRAADTLLFADKIQADINLFRLLNRRIDVNQIALEGTQINLYRAEADSIFNYQFLIDAFASDQPKDTTKTAAPWAFNLDRIQIRSTAFRMLDEFGYSDLALDVGHFDLKIKALNLAEQKLDVNRILLDKSTFRYTTLANQRPPPSSSSSVSTKADVPFPNLGWQLEVADITFNQNQLILENNNQPRMLDAVDFNHLNIDNLNLEINNVKWVSDLISAEIKDLTFADHSGFKISRFSGDASITPTQTEFKSLLIRTPQSNIEVEFLAQHQSLGDWSQQLEDQVRMDIEILPTSIAFQDLNYFAPSIQEIKQINTDLTRTIRISAKASGTLNQLDQLSINGSIANDLILQATGSARYLTQPERLSYNLKLQKLSTSYNKLLRLTNDVKIPGGLDSLGQIQLRGNFNGGINQITGKQIQLSTNTYTQFSGDFRANHLSDQKPISFNLDIQEARTIAANLEGFVPNGLPSEIQRLGQMRYTGTIDGDVYDLRSEGTLSTDVGTLVTNTSIAFNQDYSDARYRGQLSLKQFDLGYILQDTSIGKVSFDVRGAGSGLALDSLQAEIEGVVSSFEYQDYEYHNLEIDGLVQKQQFSGNAFFSDPNLNFNFQGKVNLNDSIPDLRFSAQIDTINMANLNFKNIPYAFSGKVISNFQGNNLDNLDGTARLEDIYLSNDTATIQTDSIVLVAANIRQGKRLALNSEFFDVLIEGDYQLGDLPAILVNFVNDYFPVDQILGAKDQPEELAIEPGMPKRLLPDQSFTAQLSLNEPLPLLQLFVPGLSEIDTANARLVLDTKAKNIEFSSTIPKLVFQGNAFSNIAIKMDGSPSLLNVQIRVEDIDYGMQKPLKLAEVDIKLGNDSLAIYLHADEQKGDSTFTKIALGGRATQPNENYRFVFDENFILNDVQWKVDPKNEILYRSDFLDVNNFILKKEEQLLSFKAQDQRKDEGLAPLIVGFQNFELAEIFTIINMEEANYAGKLDGNVTIRDYTSNLNYLADLSIKDIFLEGQEVGTLTLKASQDGQSPLVLIDAALRGPKGRFTAKGDYGLQSSELNLQAEMSELKVALIDPFLEGLVKESKGQISGQFDISGQATAPIIAGNLNLDSVSTILPLAGIRYTFLKEQVRFEKSEMIFSRAQLTDKNGNKAILNGSLDLSNLNNIGLDLNFSTSKFQILNTNSQDLELYYGKLFVSANVDVNGTANNPILNMRGRTLANSQLFVQPLSVEQAVASQEDFIIYGNPNDYVNTDSIQNIDQVYQLNRSGVDLTLNLEVTSDAEIQIIIDPATGDKLVCRGVADMTIEMNPSGELDILGNYRITNGSYSLNYQGILKKDFAISSGSRLDFIGDPLDTRFDVSAVYTAETPTFELIRNRITDENSSEAISAKKRKKVEVILSMRGDLNEPVINFDIQVPESGLVTNVTRQELQRLRENPTELNKQVFSLLLLNSFISQQSGGGNLADAGASVYLSSVSSLLTNQLNRLADNYIKGVDVNIGIDSYQSQYDLGASGSTITELNLGVSKRLFNDRLTVQVGGNVNVNSQNALLVEGASFSSIAGDFVLEYKLSPSGNYRLRVFRRDNYDVLNQDNTPQTGVGLTFRKSFGNVNNKKEQKSEKQKND